MVRRGRIAAEPAATSPRGEDTASTAAARAAPDGRSRNHGPRSPRRTQAPERTNPGRQESPGPRPRRRGPTAAPARPALAGVGPDQGWQCLGHPRQVGRADQFKILRDATSVWSLYYERLDAEGNRVAANAKLLGCFPIDAEHKARAKAQEHHDNGARTSWRHEPCLRVVPGARAGIRGGQVEPGAFAARSRRRRPKRRRRHRGAPGRPGQWTPRSWAASTPLSNNHMNQAKQP
jgi:hypothetical protein